MREPTRRAEVRAAGGADVRAYRRRDVRGISRILPDLDDDLLLQLFHKGARSQWTSADIESLSPVRLSSRQRQALARLLTPIYFGEQTAMAGASAILPTLMQARETSAQLYLASFIMDEARHFEVLTRLYRALDYDPLGLRDLPELLQYHHRLRQGDRLDWVWGILFSDLVGKHFYRAFAGPTNSGANDPAAGSAERSGGSVPDPRADAAEGSDWLGRGRGDSAKRTAPLRSFDPAGRAVRDPVLASLSTRILQDEARHLAFAEHYLRRNLATASDARRRALLEMRDDLFRLLEAMTERVRADAAELELDADDYLGRVWTDVEAFGTRIGLTAPPPDPPAGPPSDSPAQSRHADEDYQAGRHTDRHEERHAKDDFRMMHHTARHTEASRAAGGDLERHATGTHHAGRHAERHGNALTASQSGFSTSQNRLSACFGCVLSVFCGRRPAFGAT